MQIRLMFFATLALATFGLRTCGGPTPVTEKPSAANCTMTISGAISGTVPCMAIGGNVSTTNQSTLGITATGSVQGIANATMSLVFTGSIGAGTFTDANTPQYGAVVTGPVGSGTLLPVWIASPNPKQGSLSITVSSSTSYVSSNGSTAYFIHGTATATLPAQPNTSAKGNVTITATF